MPDKMLSMAALTLMRENAHHPWGFRLAGGLDIGQPLVVQLISDGSIAECKGLRRGDKVLQIGRERTIDMTHEDAIETISRCGNRLDLVLLRQRADNGKIENVGQSGHVKAIVHNQYNSPMNLYSNENIADTLVKQAQVLTNGVVGSQSNNMSSPTIKRSEVYRMVQEENRRGSPTGFGATSPTNFRKNTPPPPPPKPATVVRQLSSPTKLSQEQHSYSPKYHQQEPQYPPRYQQQEHQGQTQPTTPHEYRSQPNTTTSRQVSSPPVTRVQPRSDYIQEEKRTMSDQAQVQYRTYSTPQPQYSINPQSHGHGGSTHWTAPPPGSHRKPVWPPPQQNQSIITSTQSVKWGGSSRPSKRFVWPPPKGVFIEEDEDDEGSLQPRSHHHHQQINYQQQQQQAAGVPRSRIITSRKPSRLAAQAWEPYMGSQEEYAVHCTRGPSRRLRSAREVYQHASNSTPLPPTYRTPPGTQHVVFEYE